VPKGAPQLNLGGPYLIVLTRIIENEMIQTFYNVKCSLTLKQVPRQNEKFNLVSANKVLVYHV